MASVQDKTLRRVGIISFHAERWISLASNNYFVTYQLRKIFFFHFHAFVGCRLEILEYLSHLPRLHVPLGHQHRSDRVVKCCWNVEEVHEGWIRALRKEVNGIRGGRAVFANVYRTLPKKC